MTDTKLTVAEAAALIEAVLGPDTGPAFGNKLPGSGDVALVLRHGGGVDIISVMKPDATDNDGKPIDLTQLAMRGTVAVALYKLAHHKELMAEVLSTVSDELNMGKTPKGVMDS